MATLRALLDRVVVKPDEAKTETAEGIVLPGEAVEKPLTGVVLSVGPGRVCDINGNVLAVRSVKVGDRVAYSKYAGVVSPLGDGTLVMSERDLLAVIEE